jgi:hypothetical protein
MTTDAIRGFPSRPLTEADCQALARHAEIAFCRPIYHLTDDADAIVSVYLGTNERIHILIYNAEQAAWERVETVAEPASLTDESGLDSEAIQTRFEAYYDADEVAPAGYPHEPMAALAANLPSEPLSDDQVAECRERNFVVEVIPFMKRTRDERFITLFLVFEDPIERQRSIGSYGYGPSTSRWQLLGTVEGSPDDEADRDAAFDALAETTIDWLGTTYSQDEYIPAEDAVNELSS